MSEYESGSVVVVNVGRAMKEELAERARESDRSLSAEVRRALREHLERPRDDEKRST